MICALPQAWPPGREESSLHLESGPSPEMLCGIEEVFWPLSEILLTRPWKPLSPLAGFCPEHIHWLAVGLWTIPESLSGFYSLLSLVAVEYQGPIFCHMPHSLWLLLRAPSRHLSPNPPHPNPSLGSCFSSGETIFSSSEQV